jgi:hypothetical protein
MYGRSLWSYSPLSILYQFDVKLTSLCFSMCLFVLNRTIVIFYTDLTIRIVHLRWPHMCVYPLATYVCLSTRHICVCPLPTYGCLSTRYIYVSVRSPHMCACTKSGPGFLMSYGLVLFYVQWYWCELSLLKFVELFPITVYISLSESCIINW